jgi:tetratricopeptide (TPR) repeat protein
VIPNRKSQIAVEFCYRFKEEYPRGWVLWVHASTTTRFDEAYKEIARKACLPGWEDRKVNTLQLVFEWLSGESIDRWLLVLDNADDEDVFFGTKNDLLAGRGKGQKPMANYIPRNLNGSVIITTRDQRIGRRLADSGKPIAIMPMAIQEAEQLLQSKTWEDSISKEADSKNLLHDLGNLPLAITQAAAFMNENSMAVSEYLDALRASDRDIKDLLSEELEDPRRDSDTSNSVIRTWKLSFDQIRKQKPRAAEILSLMSVLDRQGIPKFLLRRENERLIEFTTAMGTLQAFSLITAEREGETFEMHRLVQLSTQRWLEAERKIAQWQREALKLLSKVFPEGIFENWATCNRLVPHAQIVVGYSFDTQTCQLHRATILNNLAVYDQTQGRYGTAVDKCTEALAAREKVLGTEHPDTLTIVSNLASVLQYQGKYEEAEGMHRRVLEEREKVLGAEHPFTLISISNLASVLRNQGKYKEAEGMHRRVLNRNEKMAGAEYPYTLINSTNLASVLRNQGKYEEAEEMHRQALKESEKVLGADHPSTLTSADNLALVLQYQGKYGEAEGMHQQVLEKRGKVLGAEHPSTLTSLSNLASVIRDQGRYKEAEEMHRQALKESEKVLGAEHPSTLTSVTNLALVLQYQGKYKEAEEMHRRVLKGSEKVLGVDHPYTLINFSNLASVIRDQGKYGEAEEMHRQVLERREKVLGVEHPSTLISLCNLASVLQDQGRYEEAEEMNRRALNEREKVLGAKHPSTLTSVSNLASVLRDLRKYEEAEKLNRRALEGRESVLATDHPDTLTSVYNLAYLLHNKGQYDAASGLYQRAIAGYQKTLGSHHPTSLACSEHYSSMLDELNERRPGDYGPET